MDPGQLVLPVAGIIAAAAVTFYVVSFQQMSEKSFEDYETKIGNDDGSQTQLKSSMSSRKRREAKQASKQKKWFGPPIYSQASVHLSSSAEVVRCEKLYSCHGDHILG